jgi:hypothetical protein
MAEFKRTRYAKSGVEFSVLFSAKFLKDEVNGYKPVLREPASVSTAGGKQATQHIVLEPKVKGEPALTAGQANVATKVCKLRTFECMRELFELRAPGKVFVIGPRSYREFFDKAHEFLKKQGMQVEIETHMPVERAAPSRRPPPRRKSAESDPGLTAFLLLVLLTVLVLGGLWYKGLYPFNVKPKPEPELRERF